VTHVENLSLPLCVLHGANDRRVPVSQARRFREALDVRGFTEGEAGDYGLPRTRRGKPWLVGH
jgi:predicted esterase